MLQTTSVEVTMIIADTGFWLALLNRRDRWNSRAKEAMSELQEPLITTLPVITETTYLLSQRTNVEKAIQFLEDAHSGWFDVFVLQQAHFGNLVKWRC
ncbi:MAG: type II toxin-antitoxin system VapC family toxin [Candidatus Methylumidiphilus sp.]